MRRILPLALFSFLFVRSFSQYHLSPITLEPPKQINSNEGIRLRCAGAPSVTRPLYIIDGSRSDSACLKSLDPKDILRIDILKGTKAIALYGYQAETGVIVISTKRNKHLMIQDEETHSALEGATVKILSEGMKQDSILFIANKNGRVDLSSLNNKEKKWKVEVSCVGYKTKTVFITKDSNRIVQLKRDYKRLQDVIVVGYSSFLCGRFCCICYNVFKTIDSSNKKEFSFGDNFKIYPNPVQAGSSLKIAYESSNDFAEQIQFISSSGQLILSEQKKMENVSLNSIQVPSNITAGIYFLRVTTKNKLSKTTKVIVMR